MPQPYIAPGGDDNANIASQQYLRVPKRLGGDISYFFKVRMSRQGKWLLCHVAPTTDSMSLARFQLPNPSFHHYSPYNAKG